MKKINLGKTSIEVSRINFGGNVLGWTLNEKESFEMLDEVAGSGINFIDTADMYSSWVPGNNGGESETIIGKWMKSRANREQMIITTKLGADMGNGNKGLSPAYIKKAVENSLKRLQTDYIDVYMSHYDDKDTPVEESILAFNELIREGKVREIGASNLEADRIKSSNEFAKNNGLKGYISFQPLYNLYDREKFETEYLPLAKTASLAVTPYYSLASGFLTGKYRTQEDAQKSSRGGGIINNYLNDRGERILAAMDNIAQDVNVPLSEIAVAWQLHKDYITAPIASATNKNQLQSLVNAASLALTEDQIQSLDDASSY